MTMSAHQETSSDNRCVLPPGAEDIVKCIVAKEILSQELQGCCNLMDNNATHPALTHDNRSTTKRVLELTESLVVRYPKLCHEIYELNIGGRKGKAPALHLLLSALCALKAPRRLIGIVVEINPKAIATFSKTSNALPIHYAAFGHPDPMVTLYLAHHYPKGLLKMQVKAGGPLHWVCKCNPRPELIHDLLQLCPEAGTMLAHGGQTLLHCLMSGRHEPPLKSLKLLCERFPAFLTSRCKQGRVPLHYACNRRGWLSTIQFLMEHAPRALLEHDESQHRCTPLEIAARTQPLDVMQSLVEPYLAQQANHHNARLAAPLANRLTNITLLHHAVCFGDADVVRYLCQSFPTMPMQRAHGASAVTPLHLACLASAPVENVQELLQSTSSGGLLLEADGLGRKPLDICRVAAAQREVKEATDAVEQRRRRAAALLEFLETELERRGGVLAVSESRSSSTVRRG